MIGTKRTKKVISWLLSLAMVLTILPVSAFAADGETFTVDELTYHIKTDPSGGYTNQVYLEEADKYLFGEVEIPTHVYDSENNIYAVTEIADYAFQSCDYITRVTIPGSVKAIGLGAFDGCTSLESVELSDGLETIHSFAFHYCTELTNITIPNSVTSIGEHAFDFSGLESITLSYNLTEISPSTFENCLSLRSVTIPNSVTSIGDRAFFQCGRLERIDIPSGVTSIGDYAFSGCEMVQYITLAEGLTSIGNNAFYQVGFVHSFESSSGMRIEIPDSVTNIGNYAFSECLVEELVLPENSRFTTIPLGLMHGCEKLSTVVIPENVTEIAASAFYDCPSLDSVDIPALNGETFSIADNAFEDNTTLRFSGGTIDVVGTSNIPNAVISGGSINFTDAPTNFVPMDNNNNPLYPITVSFRDFSGSKQTWLTIPAIVSNTSYGLENVMTDQNGKLYLWLPEGATLDGAFDSSINVWQYTDGDDSTSSDTFTVGAEGAEILFEPYLSPGSSFPILVEVLGYSNAQGFIYRQGTTPNLDSTSLKSGQKENVYYLMIDADSSVAGVNPLPEGYSLVGLYLNEELPANGEYSISDEFIIGDYLWNQGGVSYGGPTYQFTMPEETVSIKAVVAKNGTVDLGSTNPTVTVNGVTMHLDQYLPSEAFDASALTGTAPEGGYAKLYNDNGNLTLELNNATFEKGGLVLSGEGNEPSITIKLIGDNVLQGANHGLLDAYSAVGTAITFTGTGSLTAIGGNEDDNVGIFGNDIVVVESGVTITAIGGQYGIRTGSGFESSGNVVAKGGEYGIIATGGNIAIKGGTLIAGGETKALIPGAIPPGVVDCSVFPVEAGSSESEARQVWDGNGDCPSLKDYQYVRAGTFSKVNAATPDITAQPVGASYTNDVMNPAALTVAASVSDDGTLSYQWYLHNENTNSGGEAIPGATGTSYTPDISMVGTTYYYCVVTNTNNNVSGEKTASATSNVVAITVAAPQAPIRYSISVSAEPSAGGTVTGGDTYAAGEDAIVEATANDGYTFVKWMENGIEVSPDAVYRFTVNENRTLIAVFDEVIADTPDLIITGGTEGTDYTYENGVLDIKAAGTYEIKNADNVTVTGDIIKVSAPSGTVNITLGGVIINVSGTGLFENFGLAAFEITGNCNTVLILKDGTANSFDSGYNRAGIANHSHNLTIACENVQEPHHNCSATCGSLRAVGQNESAGMGGDDYENASNITISGGNIVAVSPGIGAGIGGGVSSNGSNIIISGGTVTATALGGGAGIGGGLHGSGSNIIISGGIVTATSIDGAGIGGGEIGSIAENIKIAPAANTKIYAYNGSDNTGTALDGSPFTCETDITNLLSGNAFYSYAELPDLIITGGTEGTDYTYENGVLDITAAGTYEIKNSNPDAATDDTIKVSASSGMVNITLSGVNIATTEGMSVPAFEITGDCTTNITLADGSENILNSWESQEGIFRIYAGLHNGEHPLTISCEHSEEAEHICDIDCGSLEAVGGNYAACIGGGHNMPGKNITINGGNITANSQGHAGIGGGGDGNGENITITGGNIVASSSSGAAGIGGASHGNGSNITISGGMVTATSNGGAGIGGGLGGNGNNITISGGTVTATSENGAGIGGGEGGSGSNITISGGIVTATGNDAGIGGDNQGSCSNVTISGGVVTATSTHGGGIGHGANGGTAENIKIAPAANMEIYAYNGSDDTGTALDGSPFTRETDITSLLSGNAFYCYAEEHTHNYTYTANENVITEACSCGHSETATITAPQNPVYDGTPKAATVEYSSDNWKGGELAVAYSEGGSINAGSVTASIEKGGASARVTFEIAQATPTAVDGSETKASSIRKNNKLSASAITGGKYKGIDDAELEGTYEWKEPDKDMTADSKEIVVFTPDNTNYAPVEIEVDVDVTSSSSSGGGGVSSYVVKFETNGGTEIANKTVTRNSKLAEPEAPTKDGYTFNGWYTDEELTEKYDFNKAVTKGFTLYAKWEKHDDETPVTSEWENPFTDVTTDDWFYNDVRYVNENSLMNGTSETTFAPNDNLTRAMLVTVLWRMEGEPGAARTTSLEGVFTDVQTGAYYETAVYWAKNIGIVNGVSETEFAPNDNITREQIAAIMHRYAQYKGTAPTGAWAIRLDYADLAEISDYAVEGVMYCKLNELMQGKENNNFDPKAYATRAEIAAILHRFIEANK